MAFVPSMDFTHATATASLAALLIVALLFFHPFNLLGMVASVVLSRDPAGFDVVRLFLVPIV